MSGLDKIIEEIELNAKENISQIESEANAFCDEYMNQKEAEIENEIKELQAKCEKERKLYEEKTHSGVEFERRTQLLSAKQEAIEYAVNKAYEKIVGMDTTEYFKLMEKLVAANIQPKAGELRMNQQDLATMPDSFKAYVDSLSDGERSLTISSEPIDIENGFILVYGQIEENCTLKALFEAKRESLRDLANKVLFQ